MQRMSVQQRPFSHMGTLSSENPPDVAPKSPVLPAEKSALFAAGPLGTKGVALTLNGGGFKSTKGICGIVFVLTSSSIHPTYASFFSSSS